MPVSTVVSYGLGPIGLGQVASRLFDGASAIICAPAPLLRAVQRRSSEEAVELVDILCVEGQHAHKGLVGSALVAVVIGQVAPVVKVLELGSVSSLTTKR